MKTLPIIAAALILFGTSCVSKKKFTELETQNIQTQSMLDACLNREAATSEKIKGLEEANKLLKDQNKDLKNSNAALLNNVGDLATLSAKEAENLEKSLESIKEKDMQIKTMQEAITKKDSVTLALVTSIKGVLGNLDDDDIEVSVEKGVVFISISDKMLFKSGSTTVTNDAMDVLEKVAKVVNDKPDFEFMVEGHTDDQPISRVGISDNWDLSVLRATAVVRVLQDEFGVAPERMTAAGRSQYVPVADNGSTDGRSKNRRTRIVILPKLDQYFGMIEDGMKSAK